MVNLDITIIESFQVNLKIRVDGEGRSITEPINISQQCIVYRGGRQGCDLIRDEVRGWRLVIKWNEIRKMLKFARKMHNNLMCETHIFRLWDRWKISFDENFCGFFLVGNARWEISQEMPYLVSLNLPLLLKHSIQRWMTTWSGSWSSWRHAKVYLGRPANRWESRWWWNDGEVKDNKHRRKNCLGDNTVSKSTLVWVSPPTHYAFDGNAK